MGVCGRTFFRRGRNHSVHIHILTILIFVKFSSLICHISVIYCCHSFGQDRLRLLAISISVQVVPSSVCVLCPLGLCSANTLPQIPPLPIPAPAPRPPEAALGRFGARAAGVAFWHSSIPPYSGVRRQTACHLLIYLSPSY